MSGYTEGINDVHEGPDPGDTQKEHAVVDPSMVSVTDSGATSNDISLQERLDPLPPPHTSTSVNNVAHNVETVYGEGKGTVN